MGWEVKHDMRGPPKYVKKRKYLQGVAGANFFINFWVTIGDKAGADPELLLGGGANPWGGRLPNILVVFSENPYEIKEILVRKGGEARARGAPPKSATG